MALLAQDIKKASGKPFVLVQGAGDFISCTDRAGKLLKEALKPGWMLKCITDG
jgi:hypothetical protein